MKTLKVLHAGCVTDEVKRACEKFAEDFPYKPVQVSSDGSVNCVRRVLDGEECDVLILADNSLFDLMMIPDYVDGYAVFAGNNMSLIAKDRKSILDSENWIDLLKNEDNEFGYYNPDIDPGGYRSVMACKLADRFEKGLTDIMLNRKNKKIQMHRNDDKAEYYLGYHSNAYKEKNPYVDLPDIMSFGNPEYEEIYNSVSYDFGEKTVKGSLIKHAAAIPLKSDDVHFAKEFIEIFMNLDFEKCGFKKINEIHGKNPMEKE